MLQWVQDRFVEDSQAVLPLQDKGLLRAYAIFDYLRVSQGVPLFLEAYLQRFSRSAAAMHLHLPLDLEETGQIIRELIRRNSVSEAGIRLILTAGSIPDDHYPFESRLAILCEPPRQPDPQALQEGIRLYPYPYLRFMPRVKTTHYVPYMVLLPLLRAQGWHDVLWNFQGSR